MARTTFPALSLALGLSTLSALATAQSEAPEPPPPLEPWYDAVALSAFADAYYNVNWAFPKPQDGSGVPTRYYARQQGFGLSWVGLDASYAPEPVGATVSLRFGPTARTYAGADADSALENVKQAFASWRPAGPEGALTLDFGKFDTLFGAEAAESHKNATYTRGALWNAQPLFHTGLRGTLELMPELTLAAIAVNGVNNSQDNNVGKTFGLQAQLYPSDWLSLSVGWLGGPEQDDSVTTSCLVGQAYDPTVGDCVARPGAPGGDEVVDRGGANDFEAWRHLLDFVVSAEPVANLSLLANANYGTEGVRVGTSAAPAIDNQSWYGGMLTARYALTEIFAVAVRGEYLNDKSGAVTGFTDPSGLTVQNVEMATATLTLEAMPTENFLIRLENRGDFLLEGTPGTDVFRKEERGSEDKLMTTTLGIVVKTD